jgi:leader peptidase (prepilin peptidase) / N-methyltransferase
MAYVEAGRAVSARMRPRVLAVIGAAAAGALVAATLARFGLSSRGAVWSAAQVLLVFLAAYDVATRRVPNRVTLPAAAAVVILRAALAPGALVETAAAGAAAFAFFLAFAVLTKEGVGMGDVKLAGLIGLLLGKAALLALLLGTIFGGVAAVSVLVASRGAGRGRAFAYAPYLCLGAAVAMLASHLPGLA